MQNGEGCVGRGLAIGFVSGLVGAWAMNQFWTVRAKLRPPPAPSSGEQQESREENNPTVKTAEAISRAVLGRGLAQSEKAKAGAMVHYGFGALMGALYGVLAEMTPAASAGFGTAYATALWLGADEGMVAALKLSPTPNHYPLSVHLSGLGAHLVYGTSTEAVRRTLRGATDHGR